MDEPRGSSGRWLLLAIAISFAAALAVRLWNLRWGYPFDYHPDEHTVYDNAVLMLQTGQFDPHWFHWPSLIFYLETALVFVVHWLTAAPLEVLTGTGISPGMIPEAQWGYLAIGRLSVALMGSGCAALAAAAAGTLGTNRFLPLLAGLLTALMPLHVEHSHYLTPDIPATFGASLALYGSLAVVQRGPSARRICLVGVSVGIAAGFKYNAGLVALPAALAMIIAKGSPARRLGRLAALTALSLATFLATTPYALVNHRDFLQGLGFDARHYWSGHLGHSTDEGFLWVSHALWNNGILGPVVAILAGSSVVLLLVSPGFRRRLAKPTGVLLVFVIPYLALLSTVRVTFARSFLPLLMGMVLLLTVSLQGLFPLLKSRTLRVLVALALVTALLPVCWTGVRAAWSFGLERTETLAYRWFLENVPRRAKIAREMYTPQLPTDRYQVLYRFTASDFDLERWDELDLDYVVLSSQVFSNYQVSLAGNEESQYRYRVYGELFSRPPAACFGPLPDRSTGPEIWVFPRSPRARDLHREIVEVGRCSLDWPWLSSR